MAESKSSSDDQEPLTISVPAAGKRFYGLAKNASYEAARRGDIPVVRVGGRIRAVVAACKRKLEGLVRTRPPWLGTDPSWHDYWMAVDVSNQSCINVRRYVSNWDRFSLQAETHCR